jgi:hypothetical protein
VGDLGGLDQASADLFAHRVDIDPARDVRVLGVDSDDVDVEEKVVVGLSGEPVDVVRTLRDD